MAFPHPPQHPYYPAPPPPPPPPQVSAKELRPGRRWYLIGALVLVGCLVAGVVGFIAITANTVRLPDFEAQAGAHTSETFVLEGDEEVNLGLFVTEGGTSANCAVKSPIGRTLTFAEPDYGLHGSRDGEQWRLAGSLNSLETGEYVLECGSLERYSNYAVADIGDGEDAIVRGVGLGLALGFALPCLGLAVGVPTMIVTGVRRNRHRRQLLAERAQGFHGQGPQYG